jgi:site-specific recombinase XerD
MAKFNFNLRNASSKEESQIHLIIRWSNNRLVFPTRERIAPKYWETDKKKRNFQRAKETKQFPEFPEFNTRLDKIEQDAKDVFRKYENDNDHQQPTVELLRSLLSKKFNPTEHTIKKDLFSFIDKFIEESRHKVNTKTEKLFASGTIQVYQNTRKVLEEYKKKRRKRIDFDTIDLDFYHDFTDYLRTEMRYSNNTIGKHVKTLKTFLSDATERGINNNLSFRSKRFKVITETTDSIYLNREELNAIQELDLTNNQRLEKVRDLFLVGCWTGLRFSDFSNIKPENIKGDFIELETKKTAESVVIPLHPVVKNIMRKYQQRYANSFPPAISNVKMNAYLKELGQMINLFHVKTSTGITKGGKFVTTTQQKYELITTHTARRSFATNLYLEDFPVSSIMKITGHRTEKAFQRYIKITPTENAKILQLHWQNTTKLKISQL